MNRKNCLLVLVTTAVATVDPWGQKVIGVRVGFLGCFVWHHQMVIAELTAVDVRLGASPFCCSLNGSSAESTLADFPAETLN